MDRGLVMCCVVSLVPSPHPPVFTVRKYRQGGPERFCHVNMRLGHVGRHMGSGAWAKLLRPDLIGTFARQWELFGAFRTDKCKVTVEPPPPPRVCLSSVNLV